MRNEKKTCGVYSITNLQNNKRYIGSSKNIESRWADHRRRLRKNTHHSIHLQRAWNEYGEQNFCFEILEECLKEQLFEKFKSTGSITDYLEYSMYKRKQKENEEHHKK